MRWRRLLLSSFVLAGAGCQLIVGIDDPKEGASGSGPGGAACAADQQDCRNGTPLRCVNGAWQAQAACGGSTPICAGGECVAANCAGARPTCGPNGQDSSCRAEAVPGGTFARSYDGVTFTANQFAATVSPFSLDVYEVTVGRFRAFVESYPKSKPAAGAGKHPKVANDSGWSPAWDAKLPATREALVAALRCDPQKQTWSDLATRVSEARPINCLSWYEAYAFCAFEGKRLATEAEWNFAAAAGSEQRYYAFSNPANSTLIDPQFAVYARNEAATVGSRPLGNGKWGHADLIGNLSEWVLDKHVDPYAQLNCSDCADLPPGPPMTARGGNFGSSSINELTSSARIKVTEERSSGIGARCAR
jgi:formylglycine-generating enzyme